MLGIVVQSGQKSILRRAAHVEPGDDVDDFDIFTHNMESLAGEIGQMKDEPFFSLQYRGNTFL